MGYQSLSPREKEIYSLIVNGSKASQIIDKLVITSSTYHSHRKAIIDKLATYGVERNNVGIINHAHQAGIIS